MRLDSSHFSSPDDFASSITCCNATSILARLSSDLASLEDASSGNSAMPGPSRESFSPLRDKSSLNCDSMYASSVDTSGSKSGSMAFAKIWEYSVEGAPALPPFIPKALKFASFSFSLTILSCSFIGLIGPVSAFLRSLCVIMSTSSSSLSSSFSSFLL